ncbi:MAG: hypothetical protein Q9169_007253 [Polycauliona sp. 2 TL-2023]
MVDQAHEALGNADVIIANKLHQAKWAFNGKGLEYDELRSANITLHLGPGYKKRVVQPDGSLAVHRADKSRAPPFLVIETGNTQTRADLKEKVRCYAHGTKLHLQCIIVFHIEQKFNKGHYVYMDVVKVRVIQDPAKAPKYTVEANYIIEGKQVYPDSEDSSLSFEISRDEVLPRPWTDPTPQPRQTVTFTVSDFFTCARKAAHYADAKQVDVANKRQSSSFDPNMEQGVGLPTGSKSKDPPTVGPTGGLGLGSEVDDDEVNTEDDDGGWMYYDDSRGDSDDDDDDFVVMDPK